MPCLTVLLILVRSTGANTCFLLQGVHSSGRKRSRGGSQCTSFSGDSCDSTAALQDDIPVPKRCKQPDPAAQYLAVRRNMQLWAANLHKLQPKCNVDSSLIEHALIFFTAAMALRKNMVRASRGHVT